VGLADGLDQPSRVRLLGPLLTDPILAVRIDAARMLADVPAARLPPDQVSARDHAIQEYEASLQLDADWPTANVSLGNLRLRQARFDEAK
ncbi:hypothetical protein ABTM75_19410, partial [Acinetobacter baumannii]